MQDVSLENMLLHVNDTTGHYQVKVCDPGQAVIFEVDDNGQELPVKFRGLVGKSFRPPELHEQKSYYSTKVDSWCLGWSTFYLLTAQPLFMSADPAQKDADWLLFQQEQYTTLFKQKSNLCSRLGLDFIFRLLQLEPSRRMSVADALDHAWLADPKVMPVLAPKELLPEALLKQEERRQQEAEALPPANEEPHHLPTSASYAGCGGSSPGGNCSSGSSLPRLHDTGSFGGTCQGISSPNALTSGGGPPPVSTSITWANAPTYNGNPHTPMLRVRSPMRAPRGSGVASSPRLAADRDRRRGQPLHPGVAARSPYVIATAHSPPPQMSPGSPGLHRAQNRSNGPRTASPCAGSAPHAGMHRMPLGPGEAQPPRPAFLTPRSTSRSKIGGLQSPLNKAESPDGDDRGRERAWAFKSESTMAESASKVEPISFFPHPHGRQAPSPPRAAGSAVYMARSASPMQSVEAIGGPGMPHMRPTMRTPSPVTGGMTRVPTAGFSWTQAPAPFSPRAGLSASTPMGRTASPVGAAASPIGFAWSPDPPSPRQSPRAYSPQPVGNNIAFGTKGIMVGAVRAAPRRSGPM